MFQWFRFRSKHEYEEKHHQNSVTLNSRSFTKSPAEWSHFNCGSGLIVGGLLLNMWSTADLLAVPDMPHFGQLRYMWPTSVTANIWSTTWSPFWTEENLNLFTFLCLCRIWASYFGSACSCSSTFVCAVIQYSCNNMSFDSGVGGKDKRTRTPLWLDEAGASTNTHSSAWRAF